MLKTVRIGKSEYLAMKVLAKKRGQFITYLLNEAVRQYLKTVESQEKAA